MPKIIEGAREKILMNAKRRLFEKGYLHLALREVAKESGIATGTIYNYFANKDELIATIMLEDWMETLDKMDRAIEVAPNVADGVMEFCRIVEEYYSIYTPIWGQPSVAAAAASEMKGRHNQLCRQIADRVEGLVARKGHAAPEKYSLLIAEMILAVLGKDEVRAQLREALYTRY
ncbi:MAG: TetR/AcrR family transcriptional regulator [Lachnospiraceae bacterium]|nr:TetR/AcrR family transcriptional regulator [Lachnospiraceae bacterium]